MLSESRVRAIVISRLTRQRDPLHIQVNLVPWIKLSYSDWRLEMQIKAGLATGANMIRRQFNGRIEVFLTTDYRSERTDDQCPVS